MPIGTALAIGLTAASVGGSIAGGALAAKGAGAQASAAERASAEAVAEQRRQFDIQQRNVQPWLTAGTQAMQTLQYLLGLGVPPQNAVQTTARIAGVPERAITDRFQQLQRIGADFSDLDAFGPRRRVIIDGGVRRLDEGAVEPSAIVPRGATASGGLAPGGETAPGGLAPGDFGSLMRDFSGADFQTDPGYAFRLTEGMKALERSAAARGTVLSGGTLKELARYNQGFASEEFNRAYNRFQTNRATRFNQLASIAGLGQTTAEKLGDLGERSATNIGNLIVGGQTAAAAARASGYGAWGNAIQNAAQVPLNWMLLSRLNQPGAADAGGYRPFGRWGG